METLGCKTVADLMKVSAEELADTWARLYGFYQVLGIRTFPERVGKFLPLNTWEAYANGAARRISRSLQGCNKDEMNTFLGVIGEDAWNAWAGGRKAEKLDQLTDEEKALVESYCNDIKGESYEPTVRLFSQIMFIAPQIRLSEEQTKAGGKSYTYYLTPESALPLIECGHMIEVPILFKHPEIRDFSGREFDEAFSKTMRKMWVQFARPAILRLPQTCLPMARRMFGRSMTRATRKVMVLDEKDIHTARESELKIVDWDRTYFLTNYYMP